MTETALPCCCPTCGNCTRAPIIREPKEGEPCCCPVCGHCSKPARVEYRWTLTSALPNGVSGYLPYNQIPSAAGVSWGNSN